MMKKRMFLPGLMIISLLSGGIALAGPFAGPDKGCNGAGHGPLTAEQQEERLQQRMEKMSTLLELSDTQQEQMAALLRAHRQEGEQLREQLRTAREEMDAARIAEPFNETDFRTKAVKYEQLKIERMVDRQQLQQAISALLSPQQQEKAKLLRGLMDKPRRGPHAGGEERG